MSLTVTDLFCGAGGSSIGAEKAGATLRMAANHWRLAIETHNSNFPHADHDCADVSQVDPRRYPRTDILLASPECTHHSQARSKRHDPNLFNPHGDPEAERSRATMWDVPRFAERHQYRLIVVENVVEVRKWAPWGSWLAAMDSLGYRHQCLFLNSFIAHPTPQSRDRLYVVFWRQGARKPDLDFRPSCWCARCEATVEGIQTWKRAERPGGKYRRQYFYRCATCAEVALPFAWPAASAIDWSLPCPRIGDREKPLADATMRRIRIGLERYGAPCIAELRGGSSIARPVDVPLATACASGNHHGLVVQITRPAATAMPRPTTQPWPTQTAQQEQALLVPVHHGKDGPAAKPATMPMPTQTGRSEVALVVKNYGDGRQASMTKPVTSPFGTVTAVDHHAILGLPFLVDYHGQGTPWQVKPVTQPIGTVETVDRRGLVMPEIDVDDCGFRMLEPHEIGRAMAFPETYQVLGNKRQRVRQFGNAVTPPMAEAIIERGIESLA